MSLRRYRRDRLAIKLFEAIGRDDISQAETLLKKGADPNLLLPTQGVTPFHLAVGVDRALDFVKLILSYGGNPNVRDEEGTTPVHVAASWGKLKCLQLLMVNGADPHTIDQEGRTALDMALDYGETFCIQALQEYERSAMEMAMDDVIPQYNYSLLCGDVVDYVEETASNSVPNFSFSRDLSAISTRLPSFGDAFSCSRISSFGAGLNASTFSVPAMSSTRISNFGPPISPSDLESSHLTWKEETKPVKPGAALPKTPNNTPEKAEKNKHRSSIFGGFRGNNRVSPTDMEPTQTAKYNVEVMEPEKPYVDEVDSSHVFQSQNFQQPPSYKHLFPKDRTASAYPVGRPNQMTTGSEVSSPDPDVSFPKLQGSTGFQVKPDDRRKTQVYKRPGTGNSTYSVDCGMQVTRPSKLPLVDSPNDPPRRATRSWSKRDAKVGPMDDIQEATQVETKDVNTGVQGYSLLESCFQRRGLSHLVNQTLHKRLKDKKDVEKIDVEKKDVGTSMHIDSPSRDAATSMAVDSPCKSPDVCSPTTTPMEDASTSPLILQERKFKSGEREEKEQQKVSERVPERANEFLESKKMKRFNSKQGIDCTSPDKSIEFMKSSSESCESGSAFLERTSVWVSALDDSLNCEEDWEEDDNKCPVPAPTEDNPEDTRKTADKEDDTHDNSGPASDGNPDDNPDVVHTSNVKDDQQDDQSDGRRSEDKNDKEREAKGLEDSTESTAPLDKGFVEENVAKSAAGRQEEMMEDNKGQIGATNDETSHAEAPSEGHISTHEESSDDSVDEAVEEEMAEEDEDEGDDGDDEEDDDHEDGSVSHNDDHEDGSVSHNDEVDTQIAVQLEATSMLEDLTTVTAMEEEEVQVSGGEEEEEGWSEEENKGSEEEDTVSDDKEEDQSSDCDEDEDTEIEFSTPGDPCIRHQDSPSLETKDDKITKQDTESVKGKGDSSGNKVQPTADAVSGVERVVNESEKPSIAAETARSEPVSEMTNLVDTLSKKLNIGFGSSTNKPEPSKDDQTQMDKKQQEKSFLDYSFSEIFRRRLSNTLLSRRGQLVAGEMSVSESQIGAVQQQGFPARQRFSDVQKKSSVKFDYSVTKIPSVDAAAGETYGMPSKWAPGVQRPGCLKTSSATQSSKAAVPSDTRQSKSEGGEKEPRVHFMISSHPRNLRGFDKEYESPGMSAHFKERLGHRFAHVQGADVAEDSPDKSEYCTPVSDPRLLKDPLVKTGTDARRIDGSLLGSSVGSCRKKLLGSFAEVSNVTKEDASPVTASQTATMSVSSETQLIPEEGIKTTSNGVADDDFKTKYLINYADKLKKSILLNPPKWKPYEGRDPLTEEEETLKASGTLSPGSATLVYNSVDHTGDEALLLDGGLVERRKQLLQAKARYMSDINSRSIEGSTRSAGVHSKWQDAASSSTQAFDPSSGQSSDMDTLDGDFRRKLMLRTKSNVSEQSSVPSYLVDHDQETIPYAVWVPKGYKGARPSHGQGDDSKVAFRRRRAENARKFMCLNRSRRDRSDLMSDMEFLTSDNTTDESLQSMLGLDKNRYAQIFKKPAYHFEKSVVTTDDSMQSVDERQTTQRFIHPTPGPQYHLTDGASNRSLMTSDDSLPLGDHDRYSQRYMKPPPAPVPSKDAYPPEIDFAPYSQPSSETESLSSQEQEYHVENEVSPFAKTRRSFDPDATVEYLYTDNGDGTALIERRCPSMSGSSHYSTALEDQSTLSCEDTILYDWKAYFAAESEAESEAEVVHIPAELQRLSDQQLRVRLEALGELPGPITNSTRRLYLLHLVKLLKDPAMVRFTSQQHSGYLPELAACFHGNPVKDMMEEEEVLSRQFEDPQRMWREGRLKSSFNYLLLDPRVTKNLPARGRYMTDMEIFKIFISSIFYIGKGKRARPYAHFGEAIQQMEKPKHNPSAKVKHILDIWASGLGVVSLHCYQSVIPVEAYTREACMVEAFGLSRLTNKKKGDYYGVAATWRARKKRLMGVYLLKKAMQIFLSEGERQIRPADVKIGQ
ncbi:ANKLE1 [Branchiostoma lanceolatum]|uniref:ANKLE1 protein n=1 Tax=Branchiostoma lanceolatum TaxID=7740 RepID=A0A8K0EK57_BRALA|nr:ANKLE1 [Branchiostoma lanceolatum]